MGMHIWNRPLNRRLEIVDRQLASFQEFEADVAHLVRFAYPTKSDDLM